MSIPDGPLGAGQDKFRRGYLTKGTPAGPGRRAPRHLCYVAFEFPQSPHALQCHARLLRLPRPPSAPVRVVQVDFLHLGAGPAAGPAFPARSGFQVSGHDHPSFRAGFPSFHRVV